MELLGKVYSHIARHKTWPLTWAEQVQYVFIILMFLAYGIIKLSITLYYRRIFVGVKGTLFDWISKIAIMIVVLWAIACLFSSILSCGTHFFANWSSYQNTALHYGAINDVTSTYVVSDLITDVMILCLPLPVVRSPKVMFFVADKIAKGHTRSGTCKWPWGENW